MGRMLRTKELARGTPNARCTTGHPGAGRMARPEQGPEGSNVFLLSVLFMTAWMFSVVTGFAGGFAHLLGLASVAMIVLRRERHLMPPQTKDLTDPATV